jgi:hypothetical protein
MQHPISTLCESFVHRFSQSPGSHVPCLMALSFARCVNYQRQRQLRLALESRSKRQTQPDTPKSSSSAVCALWRTTCVIEVRVHQAHREARKERHMATHQPLSDTSRGVCYSLQSRGVSLPKRHRGAIRDILTSALGRFERRVRSIRVWLEDVNGPRGGVDIRCRIDIELRPRGALSVSALATDEFTATAEAAVRARELVDRRIKKLRAQRRQLVRT